MLRIKELILTILLFTKSHYRLSTACVNAITNAVKDTDIWYLWAVFRLTTALSQYVNSFHDQMHSGLVLPL